MSSLQWKLNIYLTNHGNHLIHALQSSFFLCQWITNHLYYILFVFPWSLLLWFHFTSRQHNLSRYPETFVQKVFHDCSCHPPVFPSCNTSCSVSEAPAFVPLVEKPVSPSVSWTVLACCWAALCAGHILLRAAGPTLPQSLRSGSWKGGERWLSPFSLMIWWEGR